MIKELTVSLFELVMCLSKAVDLVSRELVDHHKRVAYVALSIAAELDLPRDEQNELILAGLLHDVGAVNLGERLELTKFENVDPHLHAIRGFLLLRKFEPFSRIASIIRYHHLPWDGGRGVSVSGNSVPIASHLLHLADRISVLVKPSGHILDQSWHIREMIRKSKNSFFAPNLVEAFEKLSIKEFFWFDLTSLDLEAILSRRASSVSLELGLDALEAVAEVFGQIIDFRSRFTATHSRGVSATATMLASLMGFSEREARQMRVAGFIHDLGKLGVPNEILEKPGNLSPAEYNVIRGHTYNTYRVLETMPEMETMAAWGAFHHERLNGLGYPFHHEEKDLSLGARIMAVADVFTAICEDRPYRGGMPSDRALKILRQMSESRVLDSMVVSVLERNFDALNENRRVAQEEARHDYQAFETNLQSIAP